jgi:hypothetical protein
MPSPVFVVTLFPQALAQFCMVQVSTVIAALWQSDDILQSQDAAALHSHRAMQANQSPHAPPAMA